MNANHETKPTPGAVRAAESLNGSKQWSEQYKRIVATIIDRETSAKDLLSELSALVYAANKFTIGCNCQPCTADDDLSDALEKARAAIARAMEGKL